MLETVAAPTGAWIIEVTCSQLAMKERGYLRDNVSLVNR